jgi:DNA-binding CsgD family transcriptional regulator
MKEALIFKNSIAFQLVGLGAILNNIGYYSKNLNSEYLDCNEFVAQHINLASSRDIRGRTDKEFGWSDQRVAFLRKHDLSVINKQTFNCLLEDPFTNAKGQKMQLLSYKAPLYKGDKLIGITGISIDVQSLNLDNKNPTKALINHLNEKFSNRESQVLYYLIRGRTALEIGKILKISKRTVEHYLNNIKNDLGVSTRSELIEKIIDDCNLI